MELRVGGYLAASLLLRAGPRQWHALAVLDSGRDPTRFIADHALTHLYLSFDDIEQPRDGKRPPTPALVERGLEFARGKDRLLVCRRAGQGRSVAMAYLIRCREQGVADAVAMLDPTRHRPNRLVVAQGAAILDDATVLAAFDAWRNRHVDIRLSDHYDRLEREFEALEAQGAVDRISGP